MKRKITLLGLGLLAFMLVAGGFNVGNMVYSAGEQSKNNIESKPTVRHSVISSPIPNEFPIVASTVFSNITGPQPGDLDGIKECGFNLCMHSSTADRFEKLLEYMEGTGLKLLMHNTSFLYHSSDKENKWQKDLPIFVNKFKNNPLVAGWEFADEPKWGQLEELRKRYDLLLETDDTHFILINLVGQIAKDFTGPCKTLGDYLDSIQNVFDMNVWSSDYYPIAIRNGVFRVSYESFYNDLEAFSLKSKETGIPMWAYCESMEYKTSQHYRPAATVPYLSFEAFSALAYGAQGIVYWTYWQRPSNSYETYISALVDLDGNKTKAWYAAQNVNRQIKALSNVFLGAEMIKCRHTGNIQYKKLTPIVEKFGPLERLTNGDKGVLVSHLKNDTKDYLMIVNHDVQNKQKVRLQFLKDVNVTELKVSSSGKLSRKNVKGTYNVTLSPGGYSIFEWNK